MPKLWAHVSVEYVLHPLTELTLAIPYESSRGTSHMMMVVLLGMAVAILSGVVVLALALWEVAFDGARAAGRGDRDVRSYKGERSTESRHRCPSGGRYPIGVTPPEAFAIAEVLRRSLPVVELDHVHAHATRNANRWQMPAGGESAQPAQTDATCPLLSSDDCCLAYGVRPLCCRCQPNATRGYVGGREQQLDQDAGIVAGLATAGLQGGVYELNGALATVLGAVDMPQRWAAGEQVFAD